MKIKNKQDFFAGLMFVAFAILFLSFGMGYKFGTAAKMGAGYFPVLISIILLLLGIIISISALSAAVSEYRAPSFNWSVLLFVLGPVVLFSLLLKPLGLIASLFLLIVLSSYASHEFGWKGTILNAVILVVLCLGVFVWMLEVQLQLWPSFIGK